MEAPGIENDQRQEPDTIEQRSCTIGTDADPADVSDRASKCAIVRGVVTESSEAYQLSWARRRSRKRCCSQRKGSVGTSLPGSPTSSNPGEASDSPVRMPLERVASDDQNESIWTQGVRPER
jgi:hypothetical protein